MGRTSTTSYSAACVINGVQLEEKTDDLSTLDAKALCNCCNKYSTVSKWRCKCGIMWHACPIHVNAPAETQGIRIQKMHGNNKSKVSLKRARTWTEARSPKGKKSRATLWEKEEESTEVHLSVETGHMRSTRELCSRLPLPPSLRRKFSHDVQL